MTKDEPRWRAVIEYRSATGVIDVQHDFEEIADLHDLIERGPDWGAIIKCTITLNRDLHDGLMTIEEAARL